MQSIKDSLKISIPETVDMIFVILIVVLFFQHKFLQAFVCMTLGTILIALREYTGTLADRLNF
jgi:hypothetical protein